MKVIMTGGGTGGHLYPAIAIADEIKRRYPESEVIFLGSKSGIESEIVPKHGYEFYGIPARWFSRGRGFIQDCIELFKAGNYTLDGIFQSKRIMRKFRPDLVIGTGGFVSAPVIIAGKMCGAKCFIHEQNAYPGIGNRMTAGMCEKIFLGFADAGKNFKKADKTVYTGNPVRSVFGSSDRLKSREKLGIDKEKFMVFSFGGSLGSPAINSIAQEYLRTIENEDDKMLIFGTGSRYYDQVLEENPAISNDNNSRIKILPYIDNMADTIAAADLVICRAGALSLAEITACRRAAIIVPYPWATDNHQYHNAKIVADAGAGILLEEDKIEVKEVVGIIEKLSEDKDRLANMEEASGKLAALYASEKIVDEIMGCIDEK